MSTAKYIPYNNPTVEQDVIIGDQKVQPEEQADWRHELTKMISQRDNTVRELQEELATLREESVKIRQERDIYHQLVDKQVKHLDQLTTQIKRISGKKVDSSILLLDVHKQIIHRNDMFLKTIHHFQIALSMLLQVQYRFENIQNEREAITNSIHEHTRCLETHISQTMLDEKSNLLETAKKILCQSDKIQATIYDFQSVIEEVLKDHTLNDKITCRLADIGIVTNKNQEHQQLVRRIREIVCIILPHSATIVVISKGDDDLLDLYGRKGMHFPQTVGGAGVGYYPASSIAAITQLEVLRSRGGEYLLVPKSALGWFDQHTKFKQYLSERYRLVLQRDETCLIFALQQSYEHKTWRFEFEMMITEFQNQFDRDPAILDWNTGQDLATKFPQYIIFSPATTGEVLPYLDRSIDIVAVSSPDPISLSEARRVAQVAVVNLKPDLSGSESDCLLEIDWKMRGAAMALLTTSIIIPTYNGSSLTEACLVALQETLPHNFEGEIIVVDDASTDDTATCLARWAQQDKRLKIIRNRKNAGFITSCNRGAMAAKGDILIFLNNDTLPQHGWLPALLRILRDYPDAGAVGGKLIYPDGRLQEAGGVIFSDGSGANFGKGDHDPDAPLYNYVREVDYCSGALLATRRSLFIEIGKFDSHYCPAYYEDTDFCFRIRERGYRVYYQPESAVIHLEGASSGTDISKGVKRYQLVNRIKFEQRWSDALKRQPAPPDRYDMMTWCALAVRGEMEGVEQS